MRPKSLTKGTGKRLLLAGAHATSVAIFRGDLISRLIVPGHSVVATAPHLTGQWAKRTRLLGALPVDTPISRRGLNPLRDLQYALLIYRLIKVHRIDYVLSYTIKPNIWVAFAARAAGVSSSAMVTGLGYAFASKHASGWRQKVVGRVAKWLYRLSTTSNERVIFQNHDDRKLFIKEGCLKDASKARVVDGSGVETHHFTVTALPEQPVFLMIARLLGGKGVREYCEAAVELRRKLPDTRCLLVGYLDDGPDCIQQPEIDQWVADGVEYLGQYDDIRPAISMASVYVLPSYREGTPRSVLEAMSMDRPIITTDVPGCRETTIHGKNGLLVPLQHHDALVAAMMGLAMDRQKRSRFDHASRQLAEQRYDSSIVNTNLLRHLMLLANEPRSVASPKMALASSA